MSSTELPDDTRERNNCTTASANHAGEESLECVKVRQEIDTKVLLNLIDGQFQKRFPIYNCRIVDQYGRRSKLKEQY